MWGDDVSHLVTEIALSSGCDNVECDTYRHCARIFGSSWEKTTYSGACTWNPASVFCRMLSLTGLLQSRNCDFALPERRHRDFG